MICFIILHYMVKLETIQCVDRLKQINGEKKIIIVDNFSPDDSGKELQSKYLFDKEVIVILNESNFGFAVGNNIGCDYARKNYNPDFYVVMNNDVEIRQDDFALRVKQIWDQEQFDVLGPDIYSTTGKIHQSPKSRSSISVEKAKKMQSKYEKKVKSKIVVPLRCYIKQLKVLKILYNKSVHIKDSYSEKQYNVPLHGSCLVFSKHFIESRREVFFPNTFFYFESEILDYECQKGGLKEVYDPTIKVYHHQNVSTNVAYNSVLKRTRFMNKCNYDSITAFLQMFDK